jgi:uncharacterized membrane protein YbaN (DUF454 family)
MKYLCILFGFISLALGVLGIFLPLLPTTPFLLLSATLFARSSPRFYHLLLNHKVLGSYIRSFLADKSIPLHIKIVSISLLWATILCSIFFVVEKHWLQLLLIVIALAVTFHILSFKTSPNTSPLSWQVQANLARWMETHTKKFLFGGLGLLALAAVAKVLGASPFCVRLLFGLAIFCKTLFLVTKLFIKRKTGFSLPLKMILTGVILILFSLLIKEFFLLLFLHKAFLYCAIVLKSTGLVLLLFSKKK